MSRYLGQNYIIRLRRQTGLLPEETLLQFPLDSTNISKIAKEFYNRSRQLDNLVGQYGGQRRKLPTPKELEKELAEKIGVCKAYCRKAEFGVSYYLEVYDKNFLSGGNENE